MTDDEIASLVFCKDVPIPADLAMVFGAANEHDLIRRTKRGAELYHSGLVPRLLVTGGGVLAQTDSEAKRMAMIARELGVSDAVLLVEDRSANTFDNVRLSVALLANQGVLECLKSVILVSSGWHMGRTMLTCQACFPRPIRIVCCPSVEGYNRNNWMDTDACRSEVRDEASLLAAFLEAGSLRWDF
ncbi:MAG: YdcF family protein [Pirellulaceae bacterium]